MVNTCIRHLYPLTSRLPPGVLLLSGCTDRYNNTGRSCFGCLKHTYLRHSVPQRRDASRTVSTRILRRRQQSTTTTAVISESQSPSIVHLTNPGGTTGTTMPRPPSPILPPTSLQLRRLFYRSALPMVGFGIMDQTVMLHAGHAIDCTLGVTFGLSTLTAAAFGQVCSDASGVMFGSTLEQLASRVGLPRSGIEAAQRSLPIVQRTRFMGALIGVICGCLIGLLNLLIIDTDRSSTLKLRAFNEEQEFEFLVEASNAVRKDATALTVTGPDVDGILASMTAALALRGCSLIELHAKRKVSGLSIAEIEEDGVVSSQQDTSPTSDTPTALGVQDVFYVVDRNTGEPFEDDELHDLAQSLLEATRTPMNAIGVKAVINELEKSNHALKQRVHRLEEVVKERQIRVVPTPHPTDSEAFGAH